MFSRLRKWWDKRRRDACEGAEVDNGIMWFGMSGRDAMLVMKHCDLCGFEHLQWEEEKKMPQTTDWAAEREDVLARFAQELAKATGDGSKKRQAGEKPPWYRDQSHEGAIFSHITKWKRGEKVDKDSGAHPLVHAAWRCLAIACSESGNVPD